MNFIYFFTFLLTIKVSASSKCPTIVSRNDWGARGALEVQHLIIPVEYVVIQHTVTPECTTKSSCIDRVFNIQYFHLQNLEYDDIGYNFLIGSDGNVYEGRGWSKVGAHTYKYNTKSIGIAFIGNFDERIPPPASIKAAKKLLECGVEEGKLDANYKLVGARQVSQTISPGLKLYKEIKTWRGWTANP